MSVLEKTFHMHQDNLLNLEVYKGQESSWRVGDGRGWCSLVNEDKTHLRL